MPDDSQDPELSRTRPGVFAVRYVLPALLLVAAVVLIVLGHARASSPLAATGVVFIGIAITVWAINWMFRLSVESNQDRDREERAREYFTRHGRWPGEDGG